MKIGYNGSTAIKRSNIELDMELCEKYAFDYMELRVSILEDYFERGGTVERIKDFFSKSRLKPHAMNSLEFFNMKSPSEFEKIRSEFERLCLLTKEVGSDLLIVVPTFNVKGTEDEINENTVDCLNQFSDIAFKHSIRVGFEMVGLAGSSVDNFTQAHKIVQAVGKNNVGLVLDIYHFYINGSKIEDLRRADGKKIFMVHINDAQGRAFGTYDSDAYRLMPGDGVIPIGEILCTLNDIGYDDICSIELFNPDIWEWEPDDAIRISKEKCENILNKKKLEQTNLL